MPKESTDMMFVELIHSMAAKGMKPTAISREIDEGVAAGSWKDAPGLRTVQRLYAEWKAIPEQIRLDQRTFHWPDSMLDGAIPWEAGQAALDLIRYCESYELERPIIRAVRWFWRLRQAAPEIPTEDASYVAHTLAAIDYARVAGLDPHTTMMPLEAFLIWGPWRGEKFAAMWRRVLATYGMDQPAYKGYVLPGLTGVLRRSAGADRDVLRRFDELLNHAQMPLYIDAARSMETTED
jgi:hypothetical protein